MDFNKLDFITQKFFINSKVLSIDLIDAGLINKTYVVEHIYNDVKSKFILQSLGDIFESHEMVNKNHKLVTDHIKKKIENTNFDLKRWKSPNLIRCKSNNLFAFPFESEYWRAMVYIDQTFSLNFLEDLAMAYQTGLGLAKFHLICSDLDCSKLENNIENFHNTKYYIDKYILTLKDFKLINLDNVEKNRVINLISNLTPHIRYVQYLLKSFNKDSLVHNVIHGDPKLSNFLFDLQHKSVVSLIDLDTVYSGFFLTDLADCIRSICNLSGEDPHKIENVKFDIKSCMYFLQGYFSLTQKEITSSFEILPEFIYLIIFELSIRFLTDFLQSDNYFKIKYKTHNLYRAEVQYRLLSSYLTQISDLTNEFQKIGIFPSLTFVSDVQKFI